ncbi:type IV toxin-antitoxin system AbiEi family antitoxin domain-containing protein [soil metagenome]
MELLSLTSLRPSGLFTAAEAAQIGLTRRRVHAWLADAMIARVIPGIYTSTGTWADATAERRLVLRAHATALRAGAPVLLSHTSAACLHGLPLTISPAEIDRHRVHLSRHDAGNASKRATHTVHQSYGVDQAGSEVDGIAAVLPVLAVFGVAEVCGFVAGVAALDAALHAEHTTMSQAKRWRRRLRYRPGMNIVERVISAADAASESPLETEARLVIAALGYRMRLQVRILDADGQFVARVDGLIEELGVVIEVDGKGKYAGNGSGSPDAVLAEKRRESAITDLGYAVVRLDRVDVSQPTQVDQRIAYAAKRAQEGVRALAH